MTHQTFWKPVKKPKEPKASSLGRRKTKKDISPLKQKALENHKPGKSSASRSEFPARVVDELKAEADGLCQCCGKRPDTSTHHVMPRGRGGRGVKTNGLRLCGGCHDAIQTNEDNLRGWIEIFQNRHGEYFWYDEQDWDEHNRKVNLLKHAETEQEARRQAIEPIAYLVSTAAGRPLRVKELRLIESFDNRDLQVFTRLMTDALNGYAAQGHLRPDRFED